MDSIRVALASAAAEIAKVEEHWQTIERQHASSITAEGIEAMQQQLEDDMVQDSKMWNADLNERWMRALVIKVFRRWARSQTDIRIQVVSQFLDELFSSSDPGRLVKSIRADFDVHPNPETARIIRCMNYFMGDAGCSATDAVERTANLLGIESYDRIKQAWQRSPESRPFKRVRSQHD